MKKKQEQNRGQEMHAHKESAQHEEKQDEQEWRTSSVKLLNKKS